MMKDAGQDYLQKFGDNLRKIRESKDLTQRRLSLQCKIDHSDISKIEQGLKNITLLTILELASSLEVTPKRLLDF